MSVDKIKRKVKIEGAGRIIIYGVEGVGKTTAGLSFPDAVLIRTPGERPPRGLEFDGFDEASTYEELCANIDTVCETTDFKTLVIDSLDSVETMIEQYLCAANGWENISSPGYGDGYTAVANEVHSFSEMLDDVVKLKGMNVVLIAHSQIIKFEPPGMASYSKYVLRLGKRVEPIMFGKADAVWFLDYKVDIEETKGKFGAKTEKAVGGDTRILHTCERPAHSGKSRYTIPSQIFINPGDSVYDKISQYL